MGVIARAFLGEDGGEISDFKSKLRMCVLISNKKKGNSRFCSPFEFEIIAMELHGLLVLSMNLAVVHAFRSFGESAVQLLAWANNLFLVEEGVPFPHFLDGPTHPAAGFPAVFTFHAGPTGAWWRKVAGLTKFLQTKLHTVAGGEPVAHLVFLAAEA